MKHRGLLTNALTLADVLTVDQRTWPAAGLNRRRWIAVTVASLVLLPMGLAVVPLWRLRARRRLVAAGPGGDNPFFSAKRSSIFEAAMTWPARLSRVLLVVLAAAGIGLAIPKLLHDSVGNPAKVGITNMNHDRPQAMDRGALYDLGRPLPPPRQRRRRENGHDYQRWTVTPKPGHLDRVLLDMDTGTVICP